MEEELARQRHHQLMLEATSGARMIKALSRWLRMQRTTSTIICKIRVKIGMEIILIMKIAQRTDSLSPSWSGPSSRSWTFGATSRPISKSRGSNMSPAWLWTKCASRKQLKGESWRLKSSSSWSTELAKLLKVRSPFQTALLLLYK